VNFDSFERANATGLAAVGNGWYGAFTADANISSGDLIFTSAPPYRCVLNPGHNLPADYSVTVSVPHATLGSYFGIVGRWSSGGNGVRLLFTGDSTSMSIGDALQWNANNVAITTDSNYPASWSVNQDHTITMRMTGTLIEIFLDNQPTRGFHATVATNSTLTNSSYGICGEGRSRAWHYIGTDQV
jgi:hypothetical protein